MHSPVMCSVNASASPGHLHSGFVKRQEVWLEISRSLRCKRIERVVHYGIELWVSSKYCSSCDAGSGDAGQTCTQISGATWLLHGEMVLVKQKLCVQPAVCDRHLLLRLITSWARSPATARSSSWVPWEALRFPWAMAMQSKQTQSHACFGCAW